MSKLLQLLALILLVTIASSRSINQEDPSHQWWGGGWGGGWGRPWGGCGGGWGRGWGRGWGGGWW